MSSTNPSPLPRLTIKDVVQIYLVAYDSVVTAYHSYSVLSFGTGHFGDEYTTVTIDVLSLGKIPVGMTEVQEISYKKLLQCDTFCSIIFEPVKARLQLQQVSAVFAVAKSETIIILVPSVEKPDVVHSTLLIHTKDSPETIFDGTAGQFHWAQPNTIINGQDCWYLYTSDGSHEDDSDGYDLGGLRKHEDGYWFRIGTNLRKMLHDLNWESLEKMSPPVREEYVRVESE